MTSNALARSNEQPSLEGLERVLLEGDLGGLSQQQRIEYYARVCSSVGLNPLTQPFEYLKLNGKTVLYAKRACTDQLRQIHNISVSVVSREKVEGVYVVTARATTPDGRTDESIGAVPIEGLKGENYANALMKAETKAKRRVTLAISGLSLLDESEMEGVQSQDRGQAKPRRTLDDVAEAGQARTKSTPPPATSFDPSTGEVKPAYTFEQHVKNLERIGKDKLQGWVSKLFEMGCTKEQNEHAWGVFQAKCLLENVDPNAYVPAGDA